MRKTRIGALLGTAGLLGGLALTAAGAAPAMAQCGTCTGNGSVNDQYSIPYQFTFTLTTSSITLTGTPGDSTANSVTPATVDYSVLTNDAAGYAVTVESGGNLIGPSGSAPIPSSDIGVWGPIGAGKATVNQPVAGMYEPYLLSNSVPDTVVQSSSASVGSSNQGSGGSQAATVTTGNASPGAAADTWADDYGFLQSNYGYTSPTGTVNDGSGVPSGQPGTYASTIAYAALGN